MKRQLLFLFIVFTGIQNAISAGPSSADVTYRHLKNMEYEVTIVAYRDCRSTPWNFIYDLLIYNDSFGLYTKPTRVKIEDIQQYCKSKICNPSNTMTGAVGIEAHYLIDTIDFNSGPFKKFVSKNYCKVYFALSTCCRNGSIVSNGNMFVESMLNLCLAKAQPINSPQFVNNIPYFVPCNLNFSYSFYSNNYLPGDSISYELVKAKNDANSEEIYSSPFSEQIPMTPLCSPPGVIYCTPSATSLPARGVTFNPKSGNFIFTPTNCTEVGVIVCRVNVFRKDSGKFKLAGYSKRDMMMIVIKGATNKPTLSSYRDYTIKARENYCIDIKIKDDTTKTTKDTVSLIVREFPKYGTLSLLDSNAREKTMHFCWNASDSDYLKKREANIAIYAYDKPCIFGQDMSTVVNFKVIAPDSLTSIKIRTFLDKNMNGIKDASEPYRSAPVLSVSGDILNSYQTDSDGMLNLKPWYGKYNININRNQFVFTTSKDTLLSAGFDSTHVVTLGFNYQQGLKGKAYEDVNNNCIFDIATDIPVKGLKIISSNRNLSTFTDANGDYLFHNEAGGYSLSIDNNSLYESVCNPSLTGTIVKDSQFYGFDFPLRNKSVFSNISVLLKPQTHTRNNAKITQTIVVENKGLVKAVNFYVKLVPSRKLFQFGSTSTFTVNKDTFYFLIGSILTGASKTIDFSHTLMTDSFINGSQITYQVWADFKDNVNSDNYYELTETVNDYVCCKTEKVVHAIGNRYPLNPVVTYRLNFIPSKNTKRAMISDKLDTNRFDLGSLQILSASGDPVIYLDHQTLKAEYSSGAYLNNAEIVYSISLKTPMTDSFTVYNDATCNFDYQPLMSTNNTSLKIVSPILYDSLKVNAFCTNEKPVLGFQCFYKPSAGNHFKVWMSDSLGNFGQPTLLLDTATSSEKNLFRLTLPAIKTSNTYKLKIIGTSPAIEAFKNVPLPVITVNPLPEIRYTTNRVNGKICENDTLHMKAFGADSYLFHKYGNQQGAYSKDSLYSDIIKMNSDYFIGFKSKAGCINNSPVINCDMFSSPDVTLDPPNSIICEGEKLNLTFKGAVTYDLYRDKYVRLVSGITSSPYSLSPTNGTHYYNMLGTDKNGCRDSSNKILIQTVPLPAQPTISRTGKALVSSYSSNNQWYDNNGKIDSAVNRTFYPPMDGKYYVKHKDGNGCESTSLFYDVKFTSVDQVFRNDLFKIYPNPASSQISIDNQAGTSYSYSISDSYGRMILNDVSEEKVNTINIEFLASGNYYIRINTSDEIRYFKIAVLNQFR